MINFSLMGAEHFGKMYSDIINANSECNLKYNIDAILILSITSVHIKYITK